MEALKMSGPACWRAVAAAALVAAFGSSAFGGSGNYLIVAAEDYVGSDPLRDFAQAKAAMGFGVSVYSVPAGTSRTTIKDYIASLWSTPDAPKYILLVGDTDGSSSTSNTIPHWSGGGSKHAPTDLPYACMDPGDDWYPDIFIGRFSVRSVSALQDVIDKSLFVEAGNFPDPDYVKRGAFLANPSTQGMAEPTHDWVIENYFDPIGYEGIRLYACEGADTQDVTDAVNYGCLWVGYYGHSGSSGWWSPAFSQSDVQALSNYGLYGVAWSFSCNVGNFTIGECFGETWLREADKGAAAVIFPSGYIYWGSVEAWEPSTVLEHSFFRAFFEDDIWEVSPAWQAGLYHFLVEYDGDVDIKRNFFELYNVLGDPALHLPEPNGFSLAANPESQNVCAPDDAVYIISVEQLGGFDEPVTLAANDAPAGTTVDFSVNPVTPPGTTVLTIGQTAAATPDLYAIQITGIAPSMQRSIVVGLGISNSTPGAVTLTSPPDGAVDVSRTPDLTWQPSSQALEYDVEVATDAGFVNVVYSVTVVDTSHLVGIYLDPLTLHYWHVRAVNACGDSGFCPAFTFTTMEQIDYFTEEFTGGDDSFGLGNFTLAFVPNGSSDYYAMCGLAAAELPTDPSGGTVLALGDDASEAITPGAPVWLYGTAHDTIYVNANGNITFAGGDSTYDESLTVHFNQPRVSALFDDLNPAAGGTVSWKETHNRVAVTWEGVPEYGTSNSNTFQIELFFTGEIHITWLEVGCNDAVVGLSEGNGVPGGYLETDLSVAGPCTWAWFDLDAEPASLDVCAPDNAVYTVTVEQMLGFDETVTLAASGEPAGTTVSFSANSLPPPFTSVMTISNTAGGSFGQYDIEIAGTATGGIERSTSVGLSLATSLPGAVTLTSPPDGAVDVSRTPTLTWQPSSQAVEYDLELATDPEFMNVVYSATAAETAHLLNTTLDALTLYYWHVRAVNPCGDTGFCPAFSFTTLAQPDYFTEQFLGDFDLDNFILVFIPDGSGDYYDLCGGEIAELPTDPTGGTVLTLTDDGNQLITPSAAVWLYGTSYDSFYVNSNGNITFTSSDGTWQESLDVHFDRPRVSGLFDDFNPAAGGTVSWKELADRVAVTWENVPEYNTSNSNTFQLELFFDGEINISWAGIDSADSIVGLSEGNGVPEDYIESDLSAAGPCLAPGDLNCDGAVNAFDIDPFVLALTNPEAYELAYPECNIDNADCNSDGDVNAFDIDPFVALLVGG